MRLQDWISLVECACAVIGATFTTYTFLSVLSSRKKSNGNKSTGRNNTGSHIITGPLHNGSEVIKKENNQ